MIDIMMSVWLQTLWGFTGDSHDSFNAISEIFPPQQEIMSGGKHWKCVNMAQKKKFKKLNICVWNVKSIK